MKFTQEELRQKVDRLLARCAEAEFSYKRLVFKQGILSFDCAMTHNLRLKVETEIAAVKEIQLPLVAALFFIIFPRVDIGINQDELRMVLTEYRDQRYPEALGLRVLEVAKLILKLDTFDSLLHAQGIPYAHPALKKELFQQTYSYDRQRLWVQHYVPNIPPNLIAYSELGRNAKVEVMDWLVKVGRNKEKRECLLRDRPGGPYLMHLRELLPEDLCPSVNQTFANWKERTHWVDPANDIVCSPPEELTDFQPSTLQVQLLRTYQDLITEGLEMAHCVATYVHKVKAGRSYIYSVRNNEERATVEICLETKPRFLLYVAQFRGPKNASPSTSLKQEFTQELDKHLLTCKKMTRDKETRGYQK